MIVGVEKNGICNGLVIVAQSVCGGYEEEERCEGGEGIVSA